MTNEAQHVAGRRVEIRHTVTVDQLREALRAYAKVSPAARRQRWFVIVAAVVLAASGVQLRSDGGTVHLLQPLVAAVWLSIFFAVTPRFRARRAHRLLGSQGGERRVVVEESGVSIETDHACTRFAWLALSRYVESRRLFVLLSADKNESCLVLLPKWNADGADRSEQLRALLDAHLSAPPSTVRHLGTGRD